jgi:hypothetical protein
MDRKFLCFCIVIYEVMTVMDREPIRIMVISIVLPILSRRLIMRAIRLLLHYAKVHLKNIICYHWAYTFQICKKCSTFQVFNPSSRQCELWHSQIVKKLNDVIQNRLLIFISYWLVLERSSRVVPAFLQFSPSSRVVRAFLQLWYVCPNTNKTVEQRFWPAF